MRYTLIILICLFVTTAFGQKTSWRKLVKEANLLYEKGNYGDAAEFYEKVWRLRPAKKKYTNLAGECYLKAREYRKAAAAFKVLKDHKNYKLAEFKYAQALKQDGRYKSANKAFVDFMNRYDEKDKLAYFEIAKKEIQGCDLGLKNANKKKKGAIVIEHLGDNINTTESEFSPIPFSEDILYFSSDMDGGTKIYRSQWQSSRWNKAKIPENFPEIIAKHYCNGTFSPDFKRFYFSQCLSDNATGTSDSWCEIYMTKQIEGGWSKPEVLRDYINQEGFSSTHPYVIHKNGREFLFFSSNRQGTLGGMDIWYTSRSLNGNDIDFNFPENAGSTINSNRDEISPIFDQTKKVLYYSSNGLINIGGFDVYKAEGDLGDWKEPQNMGTPINSSADDYFYYPKKSGIGGFFVSNRLFGLEKISTADDDIFSFNEPQSELKVEGSIYAKRGKKLLKNVEVSIFEIRELGHTRLLSSKVSPNGTYTFPLMPNREYRVEFNRKGFVTDFYEFNTYNAEIAAGYGKPIYLIKGKGGESAFNNKKPKKDTKPVNKKPSNSTKGKSYVVFSKNGTTVTTTAPRHDGVYYKVQLTVVGRFNKEDPSLKEVKTMGRLDTEHIEAKRWIRILVADFYSLDEAKKVAQSAKQYGFPESFVVRYNDGMRVTP